jgi:UDP-N-acetyl-D-galactosamine dehydrogenase
MEKIAVIGLGYVGLPLHVGLAAYYPDIVGFDIDAKRVAALREGHDWTGEMADAKLKGLPGTLTDTIEAMIGTSLFIVTVPTPIDQAKRPDLTPVIGACRTVGRVLKMQAEANKTPELTPLVVFESTVYPGLTEELCGSLIAETSGLTYGKDFKLGYSPERINPGDQKNKLETIVKIISADDTPCLDRLEAVYGKIIEAGLHRAPSIKVAEAAKVIENTQRDINIALMNELAIICDRMDIRTHEVLAAAGTKWNFLPFTPGLVGGHCIGVDPYYLTARAEELGYHPQVILAGRRINDGMAVFVAQKTIKLLSHNRQLTPNARIGILGLSFKENVRDLRNSRIPEIAAELETFGVEVSIYDPVVDPEHARREYGITLTPKEKMHDFDAVIFAVPHRALVQDHAALYGMVKKNGWIIDVKAVLDPAALPAGLHYWSL